MIDYEKAYQPTENQQRWISLLFLPTTIASIWGSSCIIYHIQQSSRKTPYRRILLAMSIANIISTIGYGLQPFLSPVGYFNSSVWAIGNSGTCAFLGALAQIAFTSCFYAAALSFYFLATVRYGMKDSTFERKFERVIHGSIVTFCIVTTIAGLALDMFRPNVLQPGCWVNSFPDECLPFTCNVELVAYIMGGIPLVPVFAFLFISNLMLYCHVRTTVREGEKKAMEYENRLSAYRRPQWGASVDDGNLEDSSNTVSRDANLDASARSNRDSSNTVLSGALRSSTKQWRRVHESGKQAFLYVGAFFLCYFWTFVKQSLSGRNFELEPNSGKILLPLLIMQSIFVPAQGFLNCFIYFRPRYNQTRKKFPSQTRLWAMRRAILGERIKPVGQLERNQNSIIVTSMIRSKAISFSGDIVSNVSVVMEPVPENMGLQKENTEDAKE